MVNPKLEQKQAEISDVIVIGAGPHSLAVCSRLLEPSPSALYSDLEHVRLSFLNKQKNHRRGPKGNKRKLIRHRNTLSGLNVRVFDKSPCTLTNGTPEKKFCANFHNLFKGLEIEYMRSPMFFHSNPRDVDALLSYAYANNYHLREIPGVVGKEVSKHKKRQAKNGKRATNEDPINERYREDFQTATSGCFFDFCRDDIEKYYGLDGVVEHGEITNLSYDYHDENHPEKLFKVIKQDGEHALAKTVVLAIGNNNCANLPTYLSDKTTHNNNQIGLEGEGWCHTSVFARPGYTFPGPALQKPGSRLLVIGGGLTSAQVVDKAYKNGVRDITLLIRSDISVKPFDFDTQWIDKYQNLNKMIFWQEECMNARMEMIKNARNGGSVNVPYYKRLRELESCGVLKIHTCTQVTKLVRDECLWDVCAVTRKNTSRSRETPHVHHMDNLKFDYLVAATGSSIDINKIDFLKQFLSENPVKSTQGLPHITENLNLELESDIPGDHQTPLFVTGGLAALQLGPSGYNLAGARDSAERIATSEKFASELFAHVQAGVDDATDVSHTLMQNLALNNGNYYDILSKEVN
ncbi:hypothetical protein E3P77_02891 [Wallemia ichthyophaga]|nr:hypothetical protein E3P77_02891 [Wallemia ichthyophaga]